MKKYLESMILASALTACAPHPKPATVTIHLQEQSKIASAPDTEKFERKMKKTDPVVQITDQMRWRLHNMNECSSRNWNACGQEVNGLFWELTKKIPKDVDRKCREDGDYTEGCVEEAYAQYVGNDALLQEYLEKDKTCKESYRQCTVEAEQNCNNECWREVKKAVENEKLFQEMHDQDLTAPKNP